MSAAETLKTTALHAAHIELGARMVPFAGYSMPVQYRDGVLAEHRWTRAHAGLFDVSHMGPSRLELNEPTGDADSDFASIADIVETLVCGDISGLRAGQLRYTLLLNEHGGIIDDLMIGRPQEPGQLYIVVNASAKEGDFTRLQAAANGDAHLVRADEGALIALQGPEAADVLEAILPGVQRLGFMGFSSFRHEGAGLTVSRSGYTGEDGFEILVPRPQAESFWRLLLTDQRVRPAGLGARDSLRLEAGLVLNGHDLDESTSPVEAGLTFAVSKARRGWGDFPGAGRILDELNDGPSRVRVGLKVLEGAPAREGAEITDDAGQVMGRVTSGGFSPTLSAPIAMGYVPPALAAPGTRLGVIVRGKVQPAEVTTLPFVPQRYVRKP